LDRAALPKGSAELKIDRTMFAGLDALRVAAPLPSIGLRPGDRRSRARGRGVELADFRPYVPGDDLRMVDWNVYARLEAVLVRLFHEDRDLQLVIVVDASASMQFGSPRKLDHAGELAACLAFLTLRMRDRVRVVIAGGRGMAKGDHVGALPVVIDLLERTDARGSADLAATLAAEAERGRVDHALLLSDLLVEPDAREAALRRMVALAKRPVLMHVLGDGELDPDLDGGILVDSETGEEIPIRGGKQAKRSYLEQLARWRAEIETRCSELGVVYAPAFTTVPARTLISSELRTKQIVEATRGGGR